MPSRSTCLAISAGSPSVSKAWRPMAHSQVGDRRSFCGRIKTASAMASRTASAPCPARAGPLSTRGPQPRPGIRADAHALVLGKVEPEPTGDLLRAPCLRLLSIPPLPRPRPFHATLGPRISWPPRGRDPAGEPIRDIVAQPRGHGQLHRLRTAGRPIRMPLSRSWPDTRGRRHAWPRCDAVRAGSWRAPARAGGRSRALVRLRRKARSPPARRTRDTAPTTPARTVQGATVA